VDGVPYFSPDYRTARERFRETVHRLGVSVDSHVIAAKGPHGEPLAMDVATIGPPRCRQALILSSGLHGVEGFLGSAVQLAWLSQFKSAAELPKVVKVVLVHALNPFGFAWLRRWNENNVDLNRNFLTDRRFLSGTTYRESLEVYDRLYSFLNPASPPSPWEPYSVKVRWRILAEGWLARKRLSADKRPSVFALRAIKNLGLTELQKTLPVGQYQHKNGLFYGGDAPEETTAWLQEKLPAWVDGTDLTLHIDFHTGLGKRADYKLLLVDPQGSPRARWAAEQFGDEVVEAWDDRTAYNANGTMAGYFRDRNAAGLYHCLTAEFGTHKGIRVLGALRAENQAHFHANPDSPNYKWAKRQILEAFAPTAPDWRGAVVDKAMTVIDRALNVCNAASAEPSTGRADPAAAADRPHE
jgi:hypothetical protein